MKGQNFKVASWNIAAINNNPFEYWITYPSESYNVLMDKLQGFLTSSPLQYDPPVSTVFLPEYFSTLKAKLIECGLLKSDQVEPFEESWEGLSSRPCISKFFTDGEIGKKRLTSMPDRTTNTVNTVNGKICRPTAINCYEKSFTSINDWFDQWVNFMFDTKLETSKGTKMGFELLQPIKKAKYPAITETEESISIPLSCLYMAVFDCVLVSLLDKISQENKLNWQEIRQNIAGNLCSNKNQKILDILKTSYSDCGLIFLQEVANSFKDTLDADELIGKTFTTIVAENSGKRDQNSVIMINKNLFADAAEDVTKEIIATATSDATKKVPIAEGDVIALKLNDLLLISFHGDTNGLATIPVIEAVLAFKQKTPSITKLVCGIDGNTYFKTKKKDQFLDLESFIDWFHGNGIESCYGYSKGPIAAQNIKNDVTTYNGRTYLQPQLNKAVGREEIVSKGDVNQKDFILFGSSFKLEESVVKDNTGKQSFVDDIAFPTMEFPSDHAVISCKLSFL
eukprot:snap_masked-scaffold_7-processed-gene-1.9-mRNA-1 protein AED:0.07 eAED:0.07 QI:0/-1/0/1/-1/1/1/0/509